MRFKELVRTGDDRVFLGLTEHGALYALELPLRERDLVDEHEPGKVLAMAVEVVELHRRAPKPASPCPKCLDGRQAAGPREGGWVYCDCPAGQALVPEHLR